MDNVIANAKQALDGGASADYESHLRKVIAYVGDVFGEAADIATQIEGAAHNLDVERDELRAECEQLGSSIIDLPKRIGTSLWEGEDHIVTLDGSPIGGTIHKRYIMGVRDLFERAWPEIADKLTQTGGSDG